MRVRSTASDWEISFCLNSRDTRRVRVEKGLSDKVTGRPGFRFMFTPCVGLFILVD